MKIENMDGYIIVEANGKIIDIGDWETIKSENPFEKHEIKEIDCKQEEIDSVIVISCSEKNPMELYGEVNIRSGMVSYSDTEGYIVNEDVGSDEVRANGRNAQEVLNNLKEGHEILQKFKEKFPRAKKIEVWSYSDDCTVTIRMKNGPSFEVDCDFDGELPSTNKKLEISHVDLTADEPIIIAHTTSQGVKVSLFEVPLNSVDEYVRKAVQLANNFNSKEVEISRTGFFLLEPCIIGYDDDRITYVIDRDECLNLAKEFFTHFGFGKLFEEQMDYIMKVVGNATQ